MNEALFREVNERIEQLQDDAAGSEHVQRSCASAAQLDCTERFAITNEEYRELRSDVHRFAVVPGHERPDVERASRRRGGYIIVEKTDPDAAEAAERDRLT